MSSHSSVKGYRHKSYREPCLCTKESRVPDFEKKGLSLFNCAHGVRMGIWLIPEKKDSMRSLDGLQKEHIFTFLLICPAMCD